MRTFCAWSTSNRSTVAKFCPSRIRFSSSRMNRDAAMEKSSRTITTACSLPPSHCRKALISSVCSSVRWAWSHCSNWSSTITTLCPSLRRSRAKVSASPRSLGRSGNFVLSPRRMRVSVSSGVASTYTARTFLDKRGINPAFTSDDLPHPEGPYINPTLNVLSGSVSSIRIFQKRMVSGSPSRSRGPGSSSMKKFASSAPNDRNPLGITLNSGFPCCDPCRQWSRSSANSAAVACLSEARLERVFRQIRSSSPGIESSNSRGGGGSTDIN